MYTPAGVNRKPRDHLLCKPRDQLSHGVLLSVESQCVIRMVLFLWQYWRVDKGQESAKYPPLHRRLTGRQEKGRLRFQRWGYSTLSPSVQDPDTFVQKTKFHPSLSNWDVVPPRLLSFQTWSHDRSSVIRPRSIQPCSYSSLPTLVFNNICSYVFLM